MYKTAKTNDEIRNWVEENGGRPAIIDDPMVENDKIGLRIDWPGRSDSNMLSQTRKVSRDISWDEFFRIMEKENLEFMYCEECDEVNNTWMYKFSRKGFVESE